MKVIAASGLGLISSIQQVGNLGVKHFLHKPYTAEMLLTTLETLFCRKNPGLNCFSQESKARDATRCLHVSWLKWNILPSRTSTFTLGEAMIDNSIRAVKKMVAAQEQGEKMVRSMLEQGRQARQQTEVSAAQWAEMVRENNKQVQQLAHTTVRLSIDSFRAAQQATIDKLKAQVEALSRQVEAQTAQSKA